MSRDMCSHGYNLREDFCTQCASPEQLRQHIAGIESLLEDERAEADALRRVLADAMEDRGVPVKPEDAADVARWAAHPEAVRHLIANPMMRHGDCPRCGDDALTSYNPACSVFLAWVALDDPRAAEAIGGAIDEVRESLREQEQIVGMYAALPTSLPPRMTHGEWVGGLSAEEQRALYGRYSLDGVAVELPRTATHGEWGLPLHDLYAHRYVDRAASDARGMEAVEDEARALNRPIDTSVWNDDGSAADPAADLQRAIDHLRRLD